MSKIQQQYGSPIEATNAGTTTATASVTGVATSTYYVTDVSGSSDKAGATLEIKDGSTIIWEEVIGNTTPYEHTFDIPLKCTLGNTISVVVTGTSASNANFSGYSIP